MNTTANVNSRIDHDFPALLGRFFGALPTGTLAVARFAFVATFFLFGFIVPDCFFDPPLGDDRASNLATRGR